MKKFYVCEICGNFVGKIYDAAPKMTCCGQEMKELVANSVEASVEKHIPVVTCENDVLVVNIGSIDHPMEEAHYIDLVYVDTKKGGQKKHLKGQSKPRAEFVFVDDEPVAVYAYCNIHGLWKTDIK